MKRDKWEKKQLKMGRFTTQKVARGFSLFEEALLIFETQDPYVEWLMKVNSAFRMQSSATMSPMMTKNELLPSYHLFFKRVDRIQCSKEPEPMP